MKVPPKRKGNPRSSAAVVPLILCLNESPSQKEGKLVYLIIGLLSISCLNESPSQKEGK